MTDVVTPTEDAGELGQGGGLLAELAFSDLYLEPDIQAWFKRSPDDRERHVVQGDLLEETQALRRRLQEHNTGHDFRVDWEGVRVRVQRIETVDGDVYVCRRLRERPMAFADLGYPPKLMKALLSEDFTKGGLVLFTGPAGAGKSTSLASWLAARLATFGGTACTIENPVEVALHGRHGTGDVVGTCYQTQVREDAEFGPSIQRILRAAPNMIFIGEIRGRDAAAQAVLAGTSGHLVSSTLHANNVQAGLERLKTMMAESRLDAGFLADSVAAVLHQTMTTTRLGGTQRRRVSVTPLIVSGAQNETAIRAHLRSGEFSQLVSEIERQRRVMSSGNEGAI